MKHCKTSKAAWQALQQRRGQLVQEEEQQQWHYTIKTRCQHMVTALEKVVTVAVAAAAAAAAAATKQSRWMQYRYQQACRQLQQSFTAVPCVLLLLPLQLLLLLLLQHQSCRSCVCEAVASTKNA
jgi:hypothetical protein